MRDTPLHLGEPPAQLRYHWDVATTRPWMKALAPLLAPAFRWNHGQVMAEGGRGLAAHLARLLAGWWSRDRSEAARDCRGAAILQP